jgi:hypothetical protein
MNCKTISTWFIALFVCATAVADSPDRDADTKNKFHFATPQRLKGGEKLIKVEQPGFACPCWADIDADGEKDLLVGQFNGGHIKIYRNLGDGKLEKGKWLKIGKQAAEVPGVW